MGTPDDITLKKFKDLVPFDTEIFEQFKGFKKQPLDLGSYKSLLSSKVIFEIK